MTVRVYRSTDGSAPSLTGTAGSLTALLDAVLVNGYGAQAAAGWSIVQTGTNKRGYKQNTVGANNPSGLVMYVDDTGPGAGGAREARFCGFETLTAITPTGTGQFPTTAQQSAMLCLRKSITADATARPWTIVANGQTIYIFIETGDVTSPYAANCVTMFGDIKSYKTTDQYAVMIAGRQTENAASDMRYEMFSAIMPAGTLYTLSNVYPGHYMARHWNAIGGSVKVGKIWDTSRVAVCTASGQGLNGSWSADAMTLTSATQVGFGRFFTTVSLPYPNPVDQSLLVSPILINHHGGVRGYLPGFWGPLHDKPLAPYDTITVASGNLAGKSFMAIYFGLYTNNGVANDVGVIMVEISDTWS